MKVNDLILIIMLTFVISTPYPILGEISKVGTAGAQFLKIGVGARAASMGFAFTAYANDATALYWNPAIPSWIEKNMINFSYTDWIIDVQYNFIGGMFPFRSSAIGISVMSVTMDKMEETTLEMPEGTGRSFNCADLALCFTYSRKMTDKVSLGANVKYIYQNIWQMTANGFAVDLATYYQPMPGLKLALVLANLGPDMKFTGGNLIERTTREDDPEFIINRSYETTPFPLPTTFRIGISLKPYSGDFFDMTTNAELVHWTDNYEQFNFGGEIKLMNYFALRGGYCLMSEKDVEWLDIERRQQENYTTRTEFDAGLNFGFGLQYNFGAFKGVFDFAWSQYEYLDNVNRFSISIEF